MEKLVGYLIPDDDYPLPIVVWPLETQCDDENILERWRSGRPCLQSGGLSEDGEIGEGPDSWLI